MKQKDKKNALRFLGDNKIYALIFITVFFLSLTLLSQSKGLSQVNTLDYLIKNVLVFAIGIILLFIAITNYFLLKAIATKKINLNNKIKILLKKPEERRKTLYLTVISLLFVFSLINGILLTYSPYFSYADYSIKVERLLELTNDSRKAHNLPELQLNPILSRAAQIKINDMDEYDYWAHFNPETQRTPWNILDEIGYNFNLAGENLAFNYKSTEGVINGWLNNPTHRENMLDIDYQEVGFAVRNVDLGKEGSGILVVQIFGKLYDYEYDKQKQISMNTTIFNPDSHIINRESLSVLCEKKNDGYIYEISIKVNNTDYKKINFHYKDNRDINVSNEMQLLGLNEYYLYLNVPMENWKKINSALIQASDNNGNEGFMALNLLSCDDEEKIIPLAGPVNKSNFLQTGVVALLALSFLVFLLATIRSWRRRDLIHKFPLLSSRAILFGVLLILSLYLFL